MGTLWNLIGIFVWLILVVFLGFVIIKGRNRQIKYIITTKKSFSWEIFGINLLYFVIAASLIFVVGYYDFFQPVANDDHKRVVSSYEYKALVMNPSGDKSTYVTVENLPQHQQSYIFNVNREKYEVDSNNAAIVTGKSLTGSYGTRYDWDKDRLRKLGVKYNDAYVAIYKAKYRDNFINGLTLRAGKTKETFTIIHIPNDTFIKTVDN